MLDSGDFLLAEGVEKDLGLFHWNCDRRLALAIKLKSCR